MSVLSATLVFSFDSNGRAPGTYSQTATVLTSDENLAGATTSSATVTLNVTVTGGNPADLNGDGTVDGADLALLLNAWGSTKPNPADIDNDGIVSGSDLSILLNSWG